MTETQENLNILNKKVGTEEKITLKPATVKILSAKIIEVGERKNKKVEFLVLHPDSTDPIKISSIKWENKGTLKVTGIWVNLDNDGNIQKGCGLSIFMSLNNCDTINDFKDKEVITVYDDKNYLTFKAY